MTEVGTKKWWQEFLGLTTTPKGDTVGRYLTLAGVFVALIAAGYAIRNSRSSALQLMNNQSARITDYMQKKRKARPYFSIYDSKLFDITEIDSQPDLTAADRAVLHKLAKEPEEVRYQVIGACELHGDYYQQSYETRFLFSRSDWNSWWRYCCDAYKNNAPLKRYLYHYREWFTVDEVLKDGGVNGERYFLTDLKNDILLVVVLIVILVASYCVGVLYRWFGWVYAEIPLLILLLSGIWSWIHDGSAVAVFAVLGIAVFGFAWAWASSPFNRLAKKLLRQSNKQGDSFLRDDIAKAAHAIWEREGRPQGRDKIHWGMAEERLRQKRKAD